MAQMVFVRKEELMIFQLQLSYMIIILLSGICCVLGTCLYLEICEHNSKDIQEAEILSAETQKGTK